jgi:FAD/FMN-containing dehydrogenase
MIIDQDDIVTHSTDSSIFKVVPKQVIFPKDEDEISAIIKDASVNNRNISVRAGGTCMDGGSLNNDIILNLTKTFTDIKVNQYSKSADVMMGAWYRDLEAGALKYNLMFAPYTSSKDYCGIGGMLGNNASGEKSVRFGATIDNVLSVKVFLRDGGNLKNLKCRKNQNNTSLIKGLRLLMKGICL